MKWFKPLPWYSYTFWWDQFKCFLFVAPCVSSLTSCRYWLSSSSSIAVIMAPFWLQSKSYNYHQILCIDGRFISLTQACFYRNTFWVQAVTTVTYGWCPTLSLSLAPDSKSHIFVLSSANFRVNTWIQLVGCRGLKWRHSFGSALICQREDDDVTSREHKIWEKETYCSSQKAVFVS